jgi:hypothetical protein
MKHLVYGHSRLTSLLSATHRWVYQLLVGRRRFPRDVPAGRRRQRKAGAIMLWFLAWIITAVLILVTAQLVELVHGVIDLYLDLADLQLALQSQYVAVTNP